MFEIIQGDSLNLGVVIRENGQPHEYDANETVRFALSDSRGSEGAVIEKTLSYSGGQYVLNLTPVETGALIPGRQYWFDIGLQSGSDYFRVIECREVRVIPGISKAVIS